MREKLAPIELFLSPVLAAYDLEFGKFSRADSGYCDT
jgi:hypothetical protein